MANSRKPPRPGRPPARTPEERQNQLVSLSYDAAEQQIREGRATSQLLTHFLKLGTERERLEIERVRGENELLKAKVDALASAKRMDELYDKALKAMSAYQGRPDLELPDD